MPLTYLATNVYEAALERTRWVFEECDDIIVSMSGGKDSTVTFHLAYVVAQELNRLPLKVFWLDQEAEWKATEDYMHTIMYSPDVIPYWFQIPFRLTNSLSFKDNFLSCWDEEARDRWIREQDPISIKVNPLPKLDRFHDLVNKLPACCDVAGKKHVGVLVGLRASESMNRRAAIQYSRKQGYKGVLWCKSIGENIRTFWPVHDFEDRDIWTAIANNNLEYNRVYDAFYKYGVAQKDMRVSALIHETAWTAIERLQETEPEMYNRYLNRVNGVNCFNHFGLEIMPRELPAYFRNWCEYRDYLLESLIEPEYRDIFRKRWKNQAGDDWYKAHITEVIVNDIDGTKNGNARSKFNMKRKTQSGGAFDTRTRERMKKHMG